VRVHRTTRSLFLLQPMHSHKLQLPSGLTSQGARRVARRGAGDPHHGAFIDEAVAQRGTFTGPSQVGAEVRQER